MSASTPTRTRPSRRRRPRSAARWYPVLLAAIVLAGVAAVVVARGGDGSAAADGPALTGEVGAMGAPVIVTPGTASGTATAAGITVDGADWALGQVPLDVAVRPTWTLRNTSDVAVTIGQPHPEVREGCCPGAYAVGTPTLAPGESTSLSFELSMHAGMDGWHDIVSHVPVTPEGGQPESLALGVTGDFRN